MKVDMMAEMRVLKMEAVLVVTKDSYLDRSTEEGWD
jgi:hypothetical protein